jgi:hypothetical protein
MVCLAMSLHRLRLSVAVAGNKKLKNINMINFKLVSTKIENYDRFFSGSGLPPLIVIFIHGFYPTIIDLTLS